MSAPTAPPGPRPAGPTRLLAALTLALALWITALSLHPFELVDGFGELWSRILDAATRLEPERLSIHVVALSLLGLTLGLWTAAGGRLFGLSLSATIPDFCLCLELGQAAVLGRHPRLGDLLVNVAVAWLGHALGRRLGERTRLLGVLAAARVRVASGTAALCLLLPLLGLLEEHTGAALGNWDPGMPLLVGNEGTGNRPWSGRIARLSLFSGPLDRAEARRLHAGGPGAADLRARAELAYDLRGGRLEPVVARGTALPLVDHHARHGPDGVELAGGAWLGTEAPTVELVTRLRMQDAFAVEVVLAPADLAQDGPARIVGLSVDPHTRDFTLGQEGRDLRFRVRTPWNGANGARFEASWEVFAEAGRELHLVAVYDHGRFRLFRDGEELGPAQFMDVPGFVLTPLTLRSGWSLAFLSLLPAGVLSGLALGALRRGLRATVQALAGLLAVAIVLLVQGLWLEQDARPGYLVLAALVPVLGDLAFGSLVRAFGPGGRLASLTRFPEPPDDRPPAA
ncbi:MAG: hypothetical protein R3F30_15055 [Planctomycetota bacterium]